MGAAMTCEMGTDNNDVGPGALTEDERERVLVASTKLLTNHGPATVTIKWVALASGVPAERVALEWPTVDALLGTVLDRLSGQVEELVGAQLSPDEVRFESYVIDTYEHIIARALLDDVNPATLLSDFSQVERWVVIYQERFGLDERTARYRLCQSFALEWGWRLFGPHLKVISGLPDEPSERFLAELRRLEVQMISLPAIEPPPGREPAPDSLDRPDRPEQPDPDETED